MTDAICAPFEKLKINPEKGEIVTSLMDMINAQNRGGRGISDQLLRWATGAKNIISLEIGAMSSTALGLNEQRVTVDAVGGIFAFEVADNAGQGSIPQSDVTTVSFVAMVRKTGPNIIRIGNEQFSNTEPMSAVVSAVQLAGFINESSAMAALGVSARTEGMLSIFLSVPQIPRAHKSAHLKHRDSRPPQ